MVGQLIRLEFRGIARPFGAVYLILQRRAVETTSTFHSGQQGLRLRQSGRDDHLELMEYDPPQLSRVQEGEMTTNMLAVFATTIATITIAIFTVALYYLQSKQHCLQSKQHMHDVKVTRANYLLALHERRMAVFNAIEDMFRAFYREGEPPLDAAVKLRHATRNAEFIFPDAPLEFIREIIAKSFRYRHLSTVLRRPQRGIAPAQEDAAREQSQAEMNDIEDWFHDQVEDDRLKTEFGPYLRLPETV